MSRYFNDAGEPLMTAAQARFEESLDMDRAHEPVDDDYDNPYIGIHRKPAVEVECPSCDYGCDDDDDECPSCGLALRE